MAFRDYWSDMCASIPRLEPPHAQKLVNRAWHRLCDFRLWSFLIPTGYITTPASISAGTITVTLGQNTIVADATAAAALNAVALANPPLAGGTNAAGQAFVGIGRQIRLASQTSGTPGPLYNIVSWDGVNTLTLDRVYAEASASGQAYQCYKAYYQPPPSNSGPTAVTDFVRYWTVTNPAVGYTIRRRKLHYTQEQLNGIDPQRGGQGDAYIVADYLIDPASGAWVHEFYPHPVTLRVYSAIFQRRGADLSDTADIPPTFPEDLLLTYAYYLGCGWALRQVSVFPELQGVNWVMARAEAYKELFEPGKGRLIQAIKADDELHPLVAFQQGGTFDFPLGGQFLQNHDLSSLVGGLD